jgi:hypothetical protein
VTLGALTNQGAYAPTGSVTAPAAPVEAVIATAPATLGDTVDVLVGDARLRVGPCRWDPVSTRTALLFPTVGVACLTDVSNQGHNHVVWWDATAAAGEVAGATNALDKTLLDAKGDLIAASADNAPARVPVGLDGQTLRANSTAAAGVGWVTPHEGAVQPGVLLGADCALTVDSATQVTVAAGTSYVRNVSGILVRTTPISTVLSGIPAASASNFRLDQIVEDSAGVVTRLAGTQGTTVTIDNRTGAAAIPSGSQLLHDLLANSTGIHTADTRDRRPWARGAFRRLLRTSGDVTNGATTYTHVDATNLNPRVECLGNPMRVTLVASGLTDTAGPVIQVVPFVDGTQPDGLTTVAGPIYTNTPAANYAMNISFAYTAVPAAGSHQFGIGFRQLGGGVAKVLANATQPLLFTVEELVRQDASNG